MPHFDVCVIGAGPAGYAAAIRAWDLGKKVCLVEGGEVGGAGLHNGALSSKTLWELSRDYRKALNRDRGFYASDVRVDWSEVRRVVAEAVREKREQMERQLRELEQPRPGHGGSIELLRGYARFLSPNEIEINPKKGRWVARVTADNFVIATGSKPRELPNIDIDGQYILTSDHVMHFEDFPESLVILGAGVVGCEFATIFANFRQTQVCLIDRATRILPFEDEDISQVCASNLQSCGVLFHQGASLQYIKRVEQGVEYALRFGDGREEVRHVERALVSVGREPNVHQLGLDAAGLECDERGRIKTQDTHTSVSHIYAVGDVSDDIALVSVGEIEGRYAIEQMFGLEPRSLRYDNLSTIMFLAPEVAAIGLNELRAREQRIPYRVATYRYNLVNRAVAMRATEGFIKLLVTNDDEMLILGMRALGVHASTAIEAVALMIQKGHSAKELAELLHPHPAVTEALQECVRMLMGTSIYKPTVFRKELRVARIHYDERGRAIETPGLSDR